MRLRTGLGQRGCSFWLALMFLMTGCAGGGMSQTAYTGYLDLRDWDFDQRGLVNLDGEWKLYWGQLLTPADFATGEPPTPAVAYPLPSSWNTLVVDGQPLPRDGAVTLRVRVPIAAADEPYGLFVPSFNSAYAVWVNGVRVAASGTVAAEVSGSQPAGFGQVARIDTSGRELDIVVQASSFEGVPGGPIGRFTLGPLPMVQTWDNRNIATDLFVASACAVIGLVYLALYLLRRKETAFLFFSLFCLIIALRTTLVGREVAHLLLPELPWGISLQFIFAAGLLGAAAFVAFVSELYAGEAWQHGTRVFGVGALLLSAVILLTSPAAVFGPFSFIFNGFTLVAVLYAAVVGVRAVWARRPGAALLMFSAVPLGLGVLVEALGSLRLIPLYSVAGFGVLGTIVAQTFTILRNFTRAFAAVEALSERLERTNRAYFRFVPREFLQLVGRDDIVAVELGDQAERLMTILFADVRGFTSMSEKMSPEENFAFINKLLGSLSPVIREQRGFIDKYMGDGIMALFPDSADDAVRAAVAMQRALHRLNVEREASGLAAIRIGIGLHCGPLMLGTVGEPERMDGTVIADAVNTASRLESLTKRYGAWVIASEQALGSGARDGLGQRMLGRVRAKGKAEAVDIFEIYEGDPAETAERKSRTRAHFEEGLRLFQAGDFEQAADHFARVAEFNPQDQAAVYYCAQAAHYAKHGAPPDWNGVEVLSEK